MKKILIRSFDKRQKNTLLLDCESIGTKDKKIYDLSFVVLDNTGNILYQSANLVKEIFCNTSLMNDAYFKKNYDFYLCELASQRYYIKTMKNIVKELEKIIVDYKVGYVTAYNANFDTMAIIQTMVELKCLGHDVEYKDNGSIDFVETFAKHFNVKVKCLWATFCELMQYNEEYKDFCRLNGYVSDKGNIITNAEIAYRFITGDLEFVEKHTGYSDVIDVEVFIYQYCKRYGKLKNVNVNCWRMVNKNKKVTA